MISVSSAKKYARSYSSRHVKVGPQTSPKKGRWKRMKSAVKHGDVKVGQVGSSTRDLQSRLGDWTLDGRLRAHNLRIFFIAISGLVLGLIELQISWHAGKPTTSSESTAGSESLDAAKKDSEYKNRRLKSTLLSTYIKIVISSLTFVLLMEIRLLYRNHVIMKRAIFGAPPDLPTWRDKSTFSMVTEMIFLSIHPPPFIEQWVWQTATCGMFIRFYLGFRIFRDYSSVYRKRKEITETLFADTICPDFGWLLSIKIYFHQKPMQFILILVTATMCFYSTIMYMMEREYQPEDFTFRNSVWYTFTTITTLGLGDITPHSARAKYLTSMMVITGMVIDTLVVVGILEHVSIDAKGRQVLVYLQEQHTNAQLRKQSGLFIAKWVWFQLVKKTSSSRKSSRSSFRLKSTKNPLKAGPSEYGKAQLAVLFARENVRFQKQKQQLIQHMSRDPVLEHLNKLDTGIVKLWRQINSNALDSTVRQTIKPTLSFINKAPTDDVAGTPSECELKQIKHEQKQIKEQNARIQGLLEQILQRLPAPVESDLVTTSLDI